MAVDLRKRKLEPERKVLVEFPEKLAELFRPHRFKVLYGGRDSAKSWSIARALLTLGAKSTLRILCTREIQKTIADSVHKLLKDQITNLGLEGFYRVLENAIVGKNGTEFLFAGLHQQTAENLKSYEGLDIVWVEEAHKVTKRSWGVLIPTIREDDSEIWVSFNPDMDTDYTYQMFVVDPPADAIVIKMNWRDNPWFSKALDTDRERLLRTDPQEYAHVYDGKCNTVVAGAIYAAEVIEMVEKGRVRNVPWDPQLKVHCIWDMGWNDSMTVILAQRMISEVRIIDYIEDDHVLLTAIVAELERNIGYVWGTHWLPHDGGHGNYHTGKSAEEVLRSMGYRVKVGARIDPEIGIKAARMMFPRVYIDKGNREPPVGRNGYRGGARLIDCLKRYRRAIPTTTMEPGDPVHDEYSHGADAYRALGLCVDKMTNDERSRPPIVPAWQQSVPGVM